MNIKTKKDNKTKHNIITQNTTFEENVVHGTKEKPMVGVRFSGGKDTLQGTPFFVARHWHHKMEIILIIEGRYEFEINLENYVLEPGDICFINSEDLHEIRGISDRNIHDVVIFDSNMLTFSYEDEIESILNPLINKDKIFPQIVKNPDNNIQKLVTALMKSAVGRKEDWYLDSKLLLIRLIYTMDREKMLIEAKGTLSANDRQRIARYKTIAQYVENNLASEITLQGLADLVSCNSQYLCRFFKEMTGKTPIQYVIDKRIDCARSMLVNTTKSVLEISFECGFENVSYFIRQFKKKEGITPKEYRKST